MVTMRRLWSGVVLFIGICIAASSQSPSGQPLTVRVYKPGHIDRPIGPLTTLVLFGNIAAECVYRESIDVCLAKADHEHSDEVYTVSGVDEKVRKLQEEVRFLSDANDALTKRLNDLEVRQGGTQQ